MSKLMEIQQQMQALELKRFILSDQQSAIEKQLSDLKREFYTLLVAEAIEAENWHDVLYHYRTYFKRMSISMFTTLADVGYNFGQTPLQFDGIEIEYSDEQHDARYAVPDLLGFTITNIQRVGDEEIIFTRHDGQRVSMYHGQDCCEVVEIESVVGDLDALIGKPLVIAEVVTNYSEDVHGDELWTFYRLGTDIGNIVTIRWHGSSNGYYSVSVHFKFV